MKKVLFLIPLLFSSLLFGFDVGDQTTAQTPQNDPNIITVQAPESFELEAVNGKKCIPKNFFCPEIKFRKINKTSNAVLKEWYLEYDQKNISNIDYQSGNYTCTYSSNDVIEFSHNFTNKFCSEELKTQKDALKDGERLLGYDFQRLNQAIESMPDILSARDTATQVEELRIPLNDVDYERKGFFTFSSMLTKILTFDTDFVGGTDLKMNLILKESMYDSSANTQTFTSGNIETVPVTIYSDGSSPQSQTSSQDTNNIFGYDNELTSLALQSVGLDAADIIDLTELVNTRTFGYLINFYFTNKSTLDFIIIVIVFLTMSKKAGITGIDQIKEKLNNLKNDRRDLITLLTIGSVAIIFFVFPLSSERIKINGREVGYSTTIAQDLVTTLADIATEYADIATNVNILNTADFLKKETKIYSKDELNSMSDQVANELIVTQRQIDFMQQQCRPAYGVYNDTFVKSKTDYLLNKNYALYSYGVPTASVCKNTESSIYFNLKNINSNSKLIDYKVNAVNDHTVSKNLEALSAKLMLTSRDFGWIMSPMIYLSPRIYEEIGASLEEEQGKKIEQLTSTYFNKNSYLEEKKEDEYSLTNIMSNATFGVDIVAEYAFMHWVPTFSTIQTKIYDSLSFKDSSETNEISQGKAKGKIMGWLSKVGSKLINKLTTAVNIVVGGSALITSYILATLMVVTAIKSIKIALITALVGYKILIYVKDLIVLYYFNILIFVRIILNKKDENFMFLTSKSIYILIYPVFIVLAISLLIFVERFGQWLLKLYSNFQLESMKMTSHIAASNQDGIIDTVKVATSSIIKIGVAEGVYETISLVLMFLLAWSMVVKLPEYLLELIGDKIGSSAQRDLTERADHKIDRTGV